MMRTTQEGMLNLRIHVDLLSDIPSIYEGRNVEQMRNRNGELLAGGTAIWMWIMLPACPTAVLLMP